MQKLDAIESVAIDLVAKIAPWLAPVPTSYLVGRSTVEHLSWPLPVGVVAAVIVEALGLATTATSLELYQYNQTRRKTDPSAPFKLAAALVLFYFSVATSLTVALDIFPVLAGYAPAIFPSLSLTGVLVMALRLDHRRRVQAIREEKDERKAERAQKRAHPLPTHAQAEPAQSAQNGPAVVQSSPSNGAQSRKERTKKTLLDAYRTDPFLGATDAGRRVGMHRNSIYNLLNELEAEGRVHRNGNGVVVL